MTNLSPLSPTMGWRRSAYARRGLSWRGHLFAKAYRRAAVAGLLSLIPAARAAGESPILDLEAVLGVEVARESPTTRSGVAQSQSLTVTRPAPGAFPVIRPLVPDHLAFRAVQVRSQVGGWLVATIVAPAFRDATPGVVLLDAEIPFVPIATLGDMADLEMLPDDLELDGKMMVRIPLGGHLVGAGLAVAFPSREMMKEAARIPVGDWVALIEKFRAQRAIDPESLFLVATREHAELALRIAGRTRFAGVVIEEPHQILFRENPAAKQYDRESRRGLPPAPFLPPPPDGSPVVAEFTREMAAGYVTRLQRVKAPLLLVMAQQSPYADFNRKTLLPLLVHAEANFRVVLLDRVARRPRVGGNTAAKVSLPAATGGAEPKVLGIQYHGGSMRTWIGRMVHFCQEQARLKPEPLPVPERRVRELGDPVVPGQPRPTRLSPALLTNED